MADRNSSRDRWDFDDGTGREYYDNNMYYGRNYDYNRNEFGYETADYSPNPRGPFSGYGPSGYARPDHKILEDINDRLTWDARIDATDISVTVTAGTVVLNGSVDTRRDKRVAEDIADSVSGVWDVHNQLRLRNRGDYRGFQGTVNRREIRPGMEVVGSQGAAVGEVKQVRGDDFLLDRAHARDLYVPFSACRVRGTQVVLNIEANQVDNQAWQAPASTSQRLCGWQRDELAEGRGLLPAPLSFLFFFAGFWDAGYARQDGRESPLAPRGRHQGILFMRSRHAMAQRERLEGNQRLRSPTDSLPGIATDRDSNHSMQCRASWPAVKAVVSDAA